MFLSIVAIVVSVIAISKVSNLEEKIRQLEARFRNNSNSYSGNHEAKATTIASDSRPPSSVHTSLENHEVVNPVHSPSVSVPNQPVQHNVTKSHTPPLYPVRKEIEKESAFVAWLKEDWLLKLGGVLVVMGVLFFLSLAYQNVGVQGKVAIGYLFGVSLMVFGFWYAKKQLVAGSSVHLIGAVVVIITTYVARTPGYDLFPPLLAMSLMFLVSVCIALMAFVYKRTELAHVGLGVSGIVPLLVSTGVDSFSVVLMYLAVVIAGSLWLAFVTQWRTLILMALAILGYYSVVYINGGMGDAPMMFGEVFMVVGFGVVFYLTSLFSIFRSGGATGKVDGLVALLNAGYVLMWIISEAPEDFRSILVAVIALVYAIGFFFVYKVTNVYTSFLVYGGVALGMLTTSIMMELSGRSLAFVLLLMGAGVTVMTYYLSKDEEITKAFAFFNLLPLFYVFSSIVTINGFVGQTGGLLSAWKDFLVLLLAFAVYVWLYRYFADKVKSLSYIALTISILLVIDVVWQVLHLVTSYAFATELSFFIIGIGLTWFMDRFFNDDRITEKVAYLNIVTFIGVFTSIARIGDGQAGSSYAYYNQPVIVDIWKDWVCVFLVMTLAFSFYYLFSKRITHLRYIGLTAGLFLVVTSVWQILHILIGGGMATFLSILIYTVVGLYNLWRGTQENRPTKIKISRIWLGAVAARVILYDAWQSGDVTIGVLICIVIGILLLSSAFIIKKVSTTE